MTRSLRSYGAPRRARTAATYTARSSAGRNEFFNAAEIDLKPEYRVTVWADEYDGEPMIELHGRRYTVYRTYLRPSGKVELYVTKKAGNHGVGN